MDNQTKNITIAKIETKMFETGTQYRLTGTDKKIYKFYNKKKDGNDTVAFTQFQDMGIKPNSTVQVWYKEEEKEYEGKKYIDRLISTFREADGVPESRQTQESAPEQEIVYSSMKNTDWDEIAVGKCQTNFLSAYIQSGKTFSEAKLQVTQARQLAEMVVYGERKEVKITGVDEPLPEDTGVNADNIPF